VNQVLKQYMQMRKMMKQYGALAAQGRLRGLGKAREALKQMQEGGAPEVAEE
jgi:signal recognition particle GTPase